MRINRPQKGGQDKDHIEDVRRTCHYGHGSGGIERADPKVVGRTLDGQSKAEKSSLPLASHNSA